MIWGRGVEGSRRKEELRKLSLITRERASSASGGRELDSMAQISVRVLEAKAEKLSDREKFFGRMEKASVLKLSP